MFRIGIDLSTTLTGVALFYENKLLFTKELKLWDINYTKMSHNIYVLTHLLYQEMYEMVEGFNETQPITIGIELSNFSSAKLTTRFNFLAGMIVEAFERSTRDYIDTYGFSKEFSDMEIKLFNANEWFKYIGNLKLERFDRKRTSLEYAKTKFGYNGNSDNIADAICIASLVDKCRDYQVINEEVKKQKQLKKETFRDKMKKKNEIIRLQQRIMNYESKGTLNKRQIEANKKAKDRLNEITR